MAAIDWDVGAKFVGHGVFLSAYFRLRQVAGRKPHLETAARDLRHPEESLS
jgi:hypothetical protein